VTFVGRAIKGVHLQILGYTPSKLAEEVLALLVRREIIVAIPGASGRQ
jgi:hypothetical protein